MIFNIFNNKTSKDNQPTSENLLSRLRRGLSKSRSHFHRLFDKLLGVSHITEETRDQLLRSLILCDVGPQTAEHLIQETERILRNGDCQSAEEALKTALSNMLVPSDTPWSLPSDRPAVLLFIGVNGSGKTTTIGKMAQRLSLAGHRVVMAAGDTFRAAAIDQIKAWGDKTNTPVITQKHGSDSASVLFESVQVAKTKPYDVLLGDTAGRLHNQANLMQELAKVKKVIQKQLPDAPHETWLVIDATVGQNGLKQALTFKESIGVTGIVLTKLDGTAKGGIVFSISRELGLPVRFIGVGEKASDLIPFDKNSFIEALLSPEQDEESLT